jgi:RNA polymerase sigma factor (TIGR02999 family)
MNTPDDAKPNHITGMLRQLKAGDPAVETELLQLVYAELRRIAARHFRSERAGHTLQTTALVHEAYLRMSEQLDQSWANRYQFFAVAAQAMRQILIDYGRRHRAQKRGSGQTHLSIDDAFLPARVRLDDVLLIDRALQRLATWDERASRVVELRFFGGLTEQETAAVLGVSVRTVKRDWTAARAWLQQELRA